MDTENMLKTIRLVINENQKYLPRYHSGESGLLGLFVGEAMKRTQGQAPPKKLNRLVIEELEKHKPDSVSRATVNRAALRVGNYIGIPCTNLKKNSELRSDLTFLEQDTLAQHKMNVVRIESGKTIDDYGAFVPIPLSAKWLIYWGFSKIELPSSDYLYQGSDLISDNYAYEKEGLRVYLPNKANSASIHLVLQKGHWCPKICDLHYVHSLQNIYLDINNEELPPIK